MERTLLTGEYRNTLDEKGRILFPSKLKASISCSMLVATLGFEKCLWLYEPEEWELVSKQVMENASIFSSKNRLVLRRLISPAQEIEIDRSNRLSIPQSLRDYAGLQKECVILGLSKYIEIWDAKNYETYIEQNKSILEEAAEELACISL